MPENRGRDLERTRERLAQWLAVKLPQATDLELSPFEAPSATGFSNDTLLSDLTWKEDGQARSQGLVVRIQPTGFTVFPEYDLARQFRIMRLLAPTDVPVPRVLWLEEEATVLDATFYVMEQVAGPLRSLLRFQLSRGKSPFPGKS